MKRIKLKTKIALAVLFIFFSVVPVVAWGSLAYFKARLHQAIASQQTALVAVVAGELDEKIRLAQEALVKTAETVPAEIVVEPARAEAFLRDRTALNHIFDNNVLLLTPNGRMIAETARTPSRTGEDFSFREYVRETIASGRPYISAPFASLLPHRHPVIAFTAPLRGEDGTMYAILVGTLDLLRPNFLGRLTTARVGRTGYFFLFNTRRTMISHPDPSRIMKNDVPPGANRRFDLAIAEGDNAGETVNSRGVRMLSAFKRLRSTDWILAVNLPVREAYEPVHRAGWTLFWIVTCGGLLIVMVMWLIMRRLSRPILSLIEQIRRIEPKGEYRPVEVRSGDEIEELADAFNGIMQRLKGEEERLHYIGNHDTLTGLYNRAFFEAELKRFGLGREFPMGIVIADLDGLKEVNDTLGHAVGDAMIREAAQILEEVFRGGDVVARIGGDEFAVLLPRTDEEAAGKILERVRGCAALRRQTITDYQFGMSMGCATAVDGSDLLAALKLADQRMYEDKASRRTFGL